MADEEPIKGKGFTVQDRRRFTETGDTRKDAEEPPPTSTHAEVPPTSTEHDAVSDRHDEPLPEINFSTFVISLSTQALMHLGEIPNPGTGQVEKDFPVAKQMIDIVAMLRDKTRGNLNSSEDKLLEDILFDLRMRYVEAVKQK